MKGVVISCYDVGIGGVGMLVDDDVVVNFQVGYFCEFGVGNDVDIDDDYIGVQYQIVVVYDLLYIVFVVQS